MPGSAVIAPMAARLGQSQFLFAGLSARARSHAIGLGLASLSVTAAAAIAGPPAWPGLLLAGLAVVGLAASPRLGALGAGLVVVLALPFGRAAELGVLVAGMPVRPHDVAIVVALLLALPAALRQWQWDTARAVFVGFLLLGVVALAMGLVSGFALRDIVRDARWWALYGFAVIALQSRASPRNLLRGVLLGATAFAIVALLVALGPVPSGGLKDQVLSYDNGLLRMQFGNSVLLIPALAYASNKAFRGAWRSIGWFSLLVIALVLSLTRVSIAVGVGTVALVALWSMRRDVPRLRLDLVRRLGPAFAAGFVSGVLAIGINIAATPARTDTPGSTVATGESPEGSLPALRRIVPNGQTVDDIIESGRFESYEEAIAEIARSPLIGRGLGSLVTVPFAYNRERAFTLYRQPGVDDAYLTVGVKAGLTGIAVFAVLMALPLWFAWRRRDRFRAWFMPAWLGMLALTMTQSFAVSAYAPFGLALLIAAVCQGVRGRRYTQDSWRYPRPDVVAADS